MDIKGKTTMFVREVGTGEKKTKIFETSLSRKDKDGNYVDKYTIQLDFKKDLLTEAQKAGLKNNWAYPVEIEGFLSTHSYVNKDGKTIVEPVIKVTNARALDKGKEIKKPEPKKEEHLNIDAGEPLEVNPDDLPF